MRLGSALGKLGVDLLVRRSVLRALVLRIAAKPARTALRRYLHSKGVLPPIVGASLEPFGTSGGQLVMLVGDPWDQVAARIWVHGASSYEQPFPELIAAIGHRVERAIVVGANSGYYCLVLALVSRCVRIDALEPVPTVVQRLRANLRLNGVEEHVVVSVAAASSKDGAGTMYVPEPRTTAWPLEMSASLSRDFQVSRARELDVAVTTVDAIRGRASQRVGLLVVDAEGHNTGVLQGCEDTIDADAPIIVTELTSDEVIAANALLERWHYLALEVSPDGIRVRDKIAEPALTFGEVPESPTGARYWMSLLTPPEQLAHVAEAASNCGLRLYPRS